MSTKTEQENREKIYVRFYSGGTPKNDEWVRSELDKRGIKYIHLCDDSSRPRPAIKVSSESDLGDRILEGIEAIQCGLFALVDMEKGI